MLGTYVDLLARRVSYPRFPLRLYSQSKRVLSVQIQDLLWRKMWCIKPEVPSFKAIDSVTAVPSTELPILGFPLVLQVQLVNSELMMVAVIYLAGVF